MQFNAGGLTEHTHKSGEVKMELERCLVEMEMDLGQILNLLNVIYDVGFTSK